MLTLFLKRTVFISFLMHHAIYAACLEGYLEKLQEYDYRKKYDTEQSAAVIPEYEQIIENTSSSPLQEIEDFTENLYFLRKQTNFKPLKAFSKKLETAQKKQLFCDTAQKLLTIELDTIPQNDLFAVAEIYHYAAAFLYESRLRRQYSLYAARILEEFTDPLSHKELGFSQKAQYCAKREMQTHMSMEVAKIHGTRRSGENIKETEFIEKLMKMKFLPRLELAQYYRQWSSQNSEAEIIEFFMPLNSKRKTRSQKGDLCEPTSVLTKKRK